MTPITLALLAIFALKFADLTRSWREKALCALTGVVLATLSLVALFRGIA